MSFEMEPMPQSTSRTATFHSDDVEALGDYRTLSVLALVSLVIGLASPLAFAAPLARTIPLVGIGVALVALRRIAVSGGVLAGRGAAVTGLALSVASLLAVLSYDQVMRRLHIQQAKAFGHSWLSMLQAGDTQRAFRLTSQGAQPEPPMDAPGGQPQKNPYDEFLANAVIQRLTQSADGGPIRLESTTSYDARGRGQCWVGQLFAVDPTSAESSGNGRSQEPIRVDLRMQRGRVPGESSPRWLVVSYQDADAVTGEASHESHTH
jgi:hypothetical protein